MMLKQLKQHFAAVVLCSACVGNAFATDYAISASSISALSDLSSVSPAVNTPSNAADYLSSGSALGYYGPIGPYGPLSVLGPVGNDTWNVSYWINAAFNSTDWFDDIDGPLTDAGPLGSSGPLSDTAYDTDLPAINDFGKQLQAGGVWTVLGPVGPLGALGPLGPLGPIGAHGFTADSDGKYMSGGVEQRTVNVTYGSGSRDYELFEHYTESYAKTKTDNDTSFMVSGSTTSTGTSGQDEYTFTSNSDQYVTITVVPQYLLDDFDLEILDDNGTVIATSNTYTYIDHIQLNNITDGTELTARVKLYSSGHILASNYRLIVVGSTDYISTTQAITGDHQEAR